MVNSYESQLFSIIFSTPHFAGNAAVTYGGQKHFPNTGRLGFNIKEDEVTSSEEATKERTVSSNGKLKQITKLLW